MRTINFEDILRKIRDLISMEDFTLATIFINTLNKNEKEKIILELKKDRIRRTRSLDERGANQLSTFLREEMTDDEKISILKMWISGRELETVTEKAKKFFPEASDEGILILLLNLSEKINSWSGIQFFSDKLNRPIPFSIFEKILKIGIANGDISLIDKVLKKYNRVLKPKEKALLFQNAHLDTLENALAIENFCGQTISKDWFIRKRDSAINRGDYNSVLLLSKMTNKKITKTELEKMLDAIIANSHLLETKKETLKNLERHFPDSVILVKKEARLSEAVESGYLADSLSIAENIGRILTMDELINIFTYKILHGSSNDDIRKVEDEMKKHYQKEVAKMEVL